MKAVNHAVMGKEESLMSKLRLIKKTDEPMIKCSWCGIPLLQSEYGDRGEPISVEIDGEKHWAYDSGCRCEECVKKKNHFSFALCSEGCKLAIVDVIDEIIEKLNEQLQIK